LRSPDEAMTSHIQGLITPRVLGSVLVIDWITTSPCNFMRHNRFSARARKGQKIGSRNTVSHSEMLQY